MLKVWGRSTSSNVQKVMWAIGELGIEAERFDIGGNFGKNREPAYLSMNPNGLVPTLQDGDFILWESNAIIRYLARGAGKLEGANPKITGLANQWMDWQLSVVGPAITPAFWGLIRTPEDKRDLAAIAASQSKTIEAMKILDAQLGKTAYVAGSEFTIGDIPVGVMTYRFWQLVPERPELPNLQRWYKSLQQRDAFRSAVEAVPLT